MKRVMITGIGGAIGVHVFAHIMHNTDWFVVGVDSFRDEHKGQFDRITRVCRDNPDWRSRIEIIQHDLRSNFSQRQIKRMGAIDYIINLASRSDVPNSLEDTAEIPTGASAEFVRNNVDIILTMLDLSRIVKPEKFIQFSTDEVYGPAEEDSNGHPEWDVILPSNPYAASKAMQEAASIAWWRAYNVPVILTNTMNNFGEMQAPSKFPAMIQKKITDGDVIDVHATKDGKIGTRYYIHSRNVADAVVFILKNVEANLHKPGEMDRPMRLNIVGDKRVSNLDLVKTIGELMGKEPVYQLKNFHEFNPGHDLHYGLDGTKLKELGWNSPQTFEESMKNTIEWQQQNPEWVK